MTDSLKILQKSWCKETSSDSDNWTEDNPAWGQCAITTVLIQEMFGGEILHSFVYSKGKDYSHYYNVLPDNSIIDITAIQFDKRAYFDSYDEPNPNIDIKNYILSYPETLERYKLLVSRFSNNLQSILYKLQESLNGWTAIWAADIEDDDCDWWYITPTKSWKREGYIIDLKDFQLGDLDIEIPEDCNSLSELIPLPKSNPFEYIWDECIEDGYTSRRDYETEKQDLIRAGFKIHDK